MATCASTCYGIMYVILVRSLVHQQYSHNKLDDCQIGPYGSLYDVLHQRPPSTERRDRTSSAAIAAAVATSSSRGSGNGASLSLTREKPSISSVGVARSASFSGQRRNSNSNIGQSGSSSSSYGRHDSTSNEEREASVNSAPSVPPIELNWRTRLLLAWQCSKGVAALHSHHMPLVHLDLKVIFL
jgi:hypothetical protein